MNYGQMQNRLLCCNIDGTNVMVKERNFRQDVLNAGRCFERQSEQ